MIDHFGFRARPFTREVTVKESFRTNFLDAEQAQLLEAIKMRQSALVIAPPGFGKTVLLRRVRNELPETRYSCHYLKVPRLSGRDLCREISRVVGAEVSGTYASLVRRVQEHMREVTATQAIYPVIMLDDAHALRDHGFELLKILSNFDMDSKLVVSFILTGHPSLKEKLHRHQFSDIRQRILHCGNLRLLSQDESHQYMSHRLRLVGCQKPPFDNSAFETIIEMSRGNMRAIDNLALKSLQEAARQQKQVVSHNEVVTAGSQLWT